MRCICKSIAATVLTAFLLVGFSPKVMAQAPLELLSATALGGSGTDEVRGAEFLPDGEVLALLEDASSLSLDTLSAEGAPAGQWTVVERNGAVGTVRGHARSASCPRYVPGPPREQRGTAVGAADFRGLFSLERRLGHGARVTG